MEVILLEKIRNLGKLGDQVNVKPGYARNYLLPFGHAVIANQANKVEFETKRAELEAAQTDALDRARSRVTALENARIEIASRASEEGKLFGSVGARELVEAIEAAGHKIERSEIQLGNGPIKEIGEHTVTLGLHPEISVDITVNVVAES